MIRATTAVLFLLLLLGVTTTRVASQSAWNNGATATAAAEAEGTTTTTDGQDTTTFATSTTSTTAELQVTGFTSDGTTFMPTTNPPAVATPTTATTASTEIRHRSDCASGLRAYNPIFHKPVYNVGLHAPGGIDAAVRQFNMTFVDYLTATAGKRFEPPIEFQIHPTNTPLYSWIDLPNEMDFFYSDTGVYSCVGVEMGAEPIAATIKSFDIRGHHEALDMFAGTMLIMKNRHKDLKTIQDIRGAVVGALEIGDFAGAQAQFYVMGENDMNYIMDPKQVIFTVNERLVVRGLMEGRWDIAFVRTGMVEMMAEEDPTIDPSDFTVLNPQLHIMDDGQMFPFMHSTPTFPEWPFFGAKHVPPEIAQEVQDALLAMKDHRQAHIAIMECPTRLGKSRAECDAMTVQEIYPEGRCDTTREIAALAFTAAKAGSIDGFRSSRSYFNLRTMQQAGGFLRENDDGEWKCTRAETLYGAIQCPEGYHRVPEDEFDMSCEIVGVPCPDGLSCFCKPCMLEVDVHLLEEIEIGFEDEEEVQEGLENGTITTTTTSADGTMSAMYLDKTSCERDEYCAFAVQTKPLAFELTDNANRDMVDIRVTMQLAGSMKDLPVTRSGMTNNYEFEIKETQIGSATLNVFVDDVRNPQSPFKVEIYPRDCKAEYGNSMEATDDGYCVCKGGFVAVNGNCWSSAIIFSLLAAFILIVALIGGHFWFRHKRNLSDQVWLVNPEELHFSDPVEVIGSGGFGEVLLAEYRGTKVAIKRVTRPGKNEKGNKRSRNKGGASLDLSKDLSKCTDNDENDSRSTEGDSLPELASDKADSFIGDIEASKYTRGSIGSRSAASVDLQLLAQLSRGHHKGWMSLCPGAMGEEEATRHKLGILGSNTNQSSVAARFLCFGRMNKRKQQFLGEMRLLSRLRHPCITTVMGAVISPFHDPMLVMEYMEYGSLADLLQNETMYTGGDVILQIMRDIAQGLRYLHSSKPPICHGDLKARNILIDSRFRAKVADFGLSEKKKNSLTGTPFFMAPEYLRGRSYSPACDIYSVGMILWEIYARGDPYQGEALMRVLRDVCDPSVNRRPKIPETMSPKMVDIMKKCWAADPFYRPQAKDLDMLLMDMNIAEAEPVTREQLAKKKEKPTGDMLYEVFPRHIADALKAGRKVEPESHDMVTIFFSDVVGFTDISRKMSPLKVSEMLERLYEAFDKLARAHKVFKVETIGDAYMGVTNLDKQQEHEHVKNIAEFALEAIEAAGKVLIDEDNPQKGYIRIRVGFHSGPVVSNVIGSLNPRYGLFGDCVNTASRMESNSKPGKILCSEDSAVMLMEQAPKLLVRQRGAVQVKGKGMMQTFWVKAPAKRVASVQPMEMAPPIEGMEHLVDAAASGNPTAAELQSENGAGDNSTVGLMDQDSAVIALDNEMDESAADYHAAGGGEDPSHRSHSIHVDFHDAENLVSVIPDDI